MGSHEYSFREQLFIVAGRLSRALPAFRGKVRAFLLLYRLLGLQGRSVLVDVTLSQPVEYRMQLDLHSWLQRLAFLTGSYEPDTVLFLERLASMSNPAGYLLDVGANIGTISIPFAVRASKKAAGTSDNRVLAIAFEAVSDNVAALRGNIRQNNLDGAVLVFPFGLGEINKTVRIQVEGDLSAGAGTGTANILADNSKWDCVTQSVEIKRLDELDLPANCGLVKIDTDGYDLKVLEGAVAFLRRSRPVIFGEFSAHCMNWHGQSLTDVAQLCESIEYQVWMRLSGSYKFTDKLDDGNFVQDLLLVPRETSALYGWCLEST